MENQIIREIEKYYKIKISEISEDEHNNYYEFYKNENTFCVNSKNEVTKLNLKGNSLITLNGLKKIANSITHLILESTQIQDFKILKNFKKLKSLDLSNNKIFDITPLDDLENLESLYLENNSLTEIPKLNLINLKQLWLYSNNLENISNIELFENLELLHLSGNNIIDISILSKFKNLKTLDLSFNKVTDISSLSKIKSWENLNISSNQIDDISALNKVTVSSDLLLRDNKIFDLTPLYFSLKNDKIGVLDILENPLQYPPMSAAINGKNSIYRWFQYNLDLAKETIRISDKKILDLGNHGLTDLSLLPELFENEMVEELILSNQYAKYDHSERQWNKIENSGRYPNNISNIPFLIKKLKNLKILIIGGDWKKGSHWNRWRIKSISNIYKLNNLEVLNISNNEIKSITNLDNLTKLKTLHANNNKITNIKSLSKIENLEEIYLSNNKLTSVDFIKDLKKIKSIDLHANKIKDLSPIINIIKKIGINDSKWDINTININDNPLDEILINIIRIKDQGEKSREIANYFDRYFKGDTVTVKRIKLILLGNTQVGKTTLADILSGTAKANGDSTHGINFFNFKIKDIEIKGYDFGGQDYYHNTHHSFFDEKSLYILIWGNGQKDILNFNNHNEILFPLNYWLGSLNKYAYKHNLIQIFSQIQNLSKLNSIDLSGIKDFFYLINFKSEQFATDKELKEKFELLVERLNYSVEEYVDNFIKKSSINFKYLKKNLKEENYKSKFGSLIDDFSFQTYIVQNIKNGNQKEWLNNLMLVQNYKFIKGFENYNFFKNKNELSTFINSISYDFVKETKILKIDNDLAKIFENEKKRVILETQEVKLLQNEIKSYSDEKLNSLLNGLHSILACYYFKVTQDLKNKLGNHSIKNIVIIDIEKFTEWIYTILNQKEKTYNSQNKENKELTFKNSEGYFSRAQAIDWLDDDFSKSKIDYLLAFMLEHKLIFKMTNHEWFFAPNHLKEEPSQTEKLFLNSFQKPLIIYIFHEYFHTSILSEIINKYFDKLCLESNENVWKYVLWKNKLIFYEEENSEKLIYICFAIDENKPTIKVSKYNNSVTDDFILDVCKFIESCIQSYDFHKMVITPNGNYIPFEIINHNSKTENNHKTNFITYENQIYRKSDFKIFLTNKKNYAMKKIFISYSKFDEDYKEELVDHLITLRDEGKIDDFNCNQIELGDNSEEVIQKKLEECDYMIALISRKFLNTKYIREFEVKKAKTLGKKIIPIIIKPCDWESSIVSEFHASLRGRIISIDNDLYIEGKVKEITEIERQGNWKFVINEFRNKILVE
ncbi:TIR domain-containing protein [Chryseobacterium sp. Tr-659]|uniref:leucine-rich repeat domain-containing protein n=1 Tax=Chryseobacterium sp. Tr-659 TaxID=2608340 RepID=UPI001420FE72|nr:leucine-rich repeat domain-containing protein [Chryseobacterium sp. Tr-659]NIF07108.1 TIR domain-containing protein [Chryseobacterium sp. Tr-659]